MAKIAAIQKKESQVSSGKTGSQSSSAFNAFEEIQKLAYQFYVERGYQDGYDQEDWARAEAIIKKKKAN